MGCCSLYFIFTQQFDIVFWLILLAAIADVFDGMVARWLMVDGGLGKQLDSLADVVSFGVVPGAILFQLIRYAFDQGHQGFGTSAMSVGLAFSGFIFTLGAALRLARFNIDERQTQEFIGLATPGATVVVIGMMLVHQKGTGPWYDWINNEYVLIGAAILLFVLMLAPIRMFSIKSVRSGWADHKLPIVFMALCIPLAIIFKGPALMILPLVYVILSLIIYRN